MNREYHRWHSDRLGREMELLVFGHGGAPAILLPTSRGRFYQNEDFGLVDAMRAGIEAGRHFVVCIDAIDGESWYDRGKHPADRIRRHEQWESYLVDEVVPFVRDRAPHGPLTLAGCSFGGFHAINVGMRHPLVFQRLVPMGGQFETDGFLDGWSGLGAHYHSVLRWLPSLDDAYRLDDLRRQRAILAVGEHDFCRPSNEALSRLLAGKGVPHDLAIWWGGTHDWATWRDMVRAYFP